MTRVLPVVLGAVLGCGAAPQPAPAPRPMPAPFTTATTLHALFVFAGQARCEPITIAPDPATPGHGTFTIAWTDRGASQSLELAFVRAAGELRVEGYRHRVDAEWRESSQCSNTYAVAWDGVELAVDRARWFASLAACQQAISARRPVATELGYCGQDLHEPSIPDAVRERSLRRFRQLLLAGGTLHVIDEDDRGHLRCAPIQVDKGSERDGVLAGVLRWTETSEDGEPIRVTTSLRLYDRPGRRYGGSVRQPDGTIVEAGPPPGYGVTFQDSMSSSGFETDDSGWGSGCGDWSEVRGIEDGVAIHSHPHYLDRSACEQAIAHELERRRWMPPQLDEDSASTGPSFGLGVGGC